MFILHVGATDEPLTAVTWSDRIGLSHITMLPLDRGTVTCLSRHALDQIRIMVRYLLTPLH